MENKFGAALARLLQYRAYCEINGFMDVYEQIHGVEQEALEKQLPKKGIVLQAGAESYGMIYGVCPACRCAELHAGDRYCLYCGQALKWRDDDEG